MRWIVRCLARSADRGARLARLAGAVGLIALRARLAPRGAAADAARRRHTRFLAVAPAYREGCAEAGRPAQGPGAERVRIAGLWWWVPADDRKVGSLSARVLGGALPLDEVLRTRRYARGGVMVDIGANIGTTAIPRLLLGHVECVYGVEPEIANYRCLMRTVSDNRLVGRVLVDRLALGAADGEASLLRASRIGRHRLLPPEIGARKASDTVPCLTLDTWLTRLGPDADRVSYVKCDVQGWESHVVAGASGLLAKRTATWELELCPDLLRAAGSSIEDLCARLAEAFDVFVDLRATGAARHPRPAAELLAAVREAVQGPRNYTNVVLWHAARGPALHRPGGNGDH